MSILDTIIIAIVEGLTEFLPVSSTGHMIITQNILGVESTPFVKAGQQVQKGQVIGECGSTGISSGPHIHYEVRVNGVQIDPLPYLPGYTRWW